MDCYAGLVLPNIRPNCVFKFEFTFRGSEVLRGLPESNLTSVSLSSRFDRLVSAFVLGRCAVFQCIFPNPYARHPIAVGKAR
jgi:hypothetical protein